MDSKNSAPNISGTLIVNAESHKNGHDVRKIPGTMTNGPAFRVEEEQSVLYQHQPVKTDQTTDSKSQDRDHPEMHELTVEGTWKAEREIEAQRNKSSSASLMVVAKWIVTFGVGMLLLACLVSVRLSVFQLSSQLWQIRPKGNDPLLLQEEWIRYSAQFMVVYLYLSVPPLVMLIRAVWYGLLDKTVPWPGKKAIVLTVLSAALESLGLCLMCYLILGRYERPISLMLMLSVLLLIPSVNMIWIVRKQDKIRITRVVIGTICLSTGLGIVVWELIADPSMEFDVWQVTVAFLCLSLAWLPSLQNYISTAISDTNINPTIYNGNMDLTSQGQLYDLNTTTDTSMSKTTTNYSSNRLSDSWTNAAWRASFIVNLCRIFFIFIFSCLLFWQDSGQSPSYVFNSQTYQVLSHLPTYVQGSSTLVAFGLGLGAGFLAYILAFATCYMNMARYALAPPLLLATPLSVVMVTVTPLCQTFLTEDSCALERDKVLLKVVAAVCLMLGHFLSFGWYLARIGKVLLQKETEVFCVPGYNGVSPDTWLTINRHHHIGSFETTENRNGPQKTKVYICTTMYREAEDEMRQLLESIKHIKESKVQRETDRCYESHIILDNGVRRKKLSEFARMLLVLVEKTLNLKQENCSLSETPYGLKLKWDLLNTDHSNENGYPQEASPDRPGHGTEASGNERTKPQQRFEAFSVHLKDSHKVKNKKRWSQVMYMSYVLDFITKASDAAEAFILATDGDVKFTAESVEALLDLMTRDDNVGAVCARTHPMGSGPLVWFQIFEYAIGHWFQKAAEHVLGSVLCAPGCFSVYRCSALKDVLPKYAKSVETALDFLTKDMGEDRWLCTLLVQNGWRIEYCAASENGTNCPSNFDEFYTQRRRWIVSTLANQMLILREWKYVHYLNHRVSIVFLLYQSLLLSSALIGPGTVILVVSGGLFYAWHIQAVTVILLQIATCMAFTGFCLFATQETQLKVAKIYTFVYAIAMTAVAVGTATQMVDEYTSSSNNSTTTDSENEHVAISISTLYVLILTCIFLLTGLLHPRELYCLLHSLWYLLCLPSAYLILTIYSICNITDSSWGTREQTVDNSAVKAAPWQERIQNFFDMFFCFKRKRQGGREEEKEREETRSCLPAKCEDQLGLSEACTRTLAAFNVADEKPWSQEGDDRPTDMTIMPVEEWLRGEHGSMGRTDSKHVKLFKELGFDNTLFIAGMTKTDLKRIGITSRGDVQYLLAKIADIEHFEITYDVPINTKEWLEKIGLPMYYENFKENHIEDQKQILLLKSFTREEIEKELKITKPGHIKRLEYAISRLKFPTEAQQEVIDMQKKIDRVEMKQLDEKEENFWHRLREKRLKLELEAFSLDQDVKAKLVDLRNDWLMVLAVSNTLWLILISSLSANRSLTVLATNPLGLVVLVLFVFVLSLQFLTMLLHRLYTISHYLARAPYRRGGQLADTSYRDRIRNCTLACCGCCVRNRSTHITLPLLENISSNEHDIDETDPLISRHESI